MTRKKPERDAFKFAPGAKEIDSEDLNPEIKVFNAAADTTSLNVDKDGWRTYRG